jgi:hypothetical protein
VFSAADHVLPPLGDKCPTAHHPGGLQANVAEIAANDWLFKGYRPPMASTQFAAYRDAGDPRAEGRGRRPARNRQSPRPMNWWRR